MFFIEGRRSIRQIIENGIIKIEGLFFDESQQIWQQNFWNDKINEFSIATVDKNNFEKISDTNNPQGIMALCRMPEESDTPAMTNQNGVILATDAIQDPGNMGTIIRTAAWFGVNALLVGKGSVDIFHPKTVRSTAGATGSLPYQTGSLDKILPKFEDQGWNVLLLDGSKKATGLKNMHQTSQTILVVGNEANGIRSELFTSNRPSVQIKSQSSQKNVESLNAAMATSIALYEFC